MIWNFLIPHITFWKEHGDTVDAACSRTGFYFEELANKYHLHMYEIPFTRQPFTLVNLQAWRQLEKLVSSGHYDVVVSQEPVGGVLGRLAGHRSGAKNIYTAHGFHFYKGAPRKNWLLYYPIERAMSRITDVLVTINEEDYLAAKKFKSKKAVKINGIGVDLNRFSHVETDAESKKKELKIPPEKKVILTVAEMIPRKNYETALKAIARLKKEPLVYLICGDGELQGRLSALSEELGIRDKIIFLGFRKDVNEIYHCADLFFFPSFQEGLSIALIEAMTAGLPVVCSRIRGNTDLIVDGKGGYLCEPTDDKAFATCIKKVLEDDHQCFGSYNAEHVKEFDIQFATADFYRAIQMSMENRHE